MSPADAPSAGGDGTAPQPCLICTSVTATTLAAFLGEIEEAGAAGVDVIELRLDFLQDFDPEEDLELIMRACKLPFIVTYRPVWEGGNYAGPEAPRLATLKLAALRGAPYVDVEFKAAQYFFADTHEVPLNTKVILSYHDFKTTPEAATLATLAQSMWDAGADIVKIAAMANDITDSARMLTLLQNKKGPTIALSMGERGMITRLLASKYGGYLTFAALSPARASAPGQPTVQQLLGLFNFRGQRPDSRLFGIIGNPVGHSRSPLIHNTAFQHIGFPGVYVPLLVDDLGRFLAAFGSHDFDGFSVTIPHKEAALRLAAEVDPVAAQIGAVNTLIRQPDSSDAGSSSSSSSSSTAPGNPVGRFKGFNTDWSAAISAIERALSGSGASSASPGGDSPLKGRTVVVIGAGGAGRALAFGAVSKGASVVIVNRSRERAEQLAATVGAGASVASWEDLLAGRVTGDVLANSTSVGMQPKVEETPAPAEVLGKFRVVFDAVYTPLWTRLLREARDAGCVTVDGLQMFVGQAVDQFVMFTGGQVAPVELMGRVVGDSLRQAAEAAAAATASAKK